jgi:VIT1/CCC1 family predicted Fe2+/Mn2+ transporter
VEPSVIVLAGIAGLLAGAFSMAAGEYVSMRAQREVFERLIHLEAHEIATDPDGEIKELTEIYTERGIPQHTAREAAAAIHDDPELALDVHAREELGLDPGDLGSPWGASFSSFLTFAVGAFVPLVPFLLLDGAAAKWIAVAISMVALFSVGAAMTVLTGRNWMWSGGRMVLIGGTAAAVTFGIGNLLGVAIG